MKNILDKIKNLYSLPEYVLRQVNAHEGGRNLVFICECDNRNLYIVRISLTGDRTEAEYRAETEFVHYLASNGASVADVIPSVNGKLTEKISFNGVKGFVSLFEYAKGILISDNGYQYRKGKPLSEYFYNTGKTLGKIHGLSKEYKPSHRRKNYFEKYNKEYINRLIPDIYSELKLAIIEKLEQFKELPQSKSDYGLVHFDFSDGNYHIDMSCGKITVFDFDNCMNCWYMFDLANLWIHGTGWIFTEQDREKRKNFMTEYFNVIIEGYKSETDISEEMLEKLPLFIDMVLIENITDEFESCKRNAEDVLYENIKDAAECLIEKIPYAGFC